MLQKVLLIDFGSQITQLIARRIREAEIYCEIVPFPHAEEACTRLQPAALILSGGPASVLDAQAPLLPQALFSCGIPILGICYGQQLMAHQLGGEVTAHEYQEFGPTSLDILAPCPLFEGVWKPGGQALVWMSHGDRIHKLPPGFQGYARSRGAPFAIIGDEKRRLYAVQFHLEAAHTVDGAKLLQNFLYKIVGLEKNWSLGSFHTQIVERIRQQVGPGKVLCGLSGGVDSAVAALLMHEAIGPQLTCLFVDHGFLRHGEAEEVMTLFQDHYHLPVCKVEAQDKFLKAIAGITDPEQKRKMIGHLFVEIFEAEAEKMGGIDFLGQGTLYPDVVESVSVQGGPSVTIKSHHNVGGLPQQMKMALVEPLRELFKDEVRQLGRQLNLPDFFIQRHPFPGPGLAIRCIGEVTEEKLSLLRAADRIYLSELRAANLYDEIWQAFAVLLPVRSVGTMGDRRTYEYVCALRAVQAVDGMTASSYPFDIFLLQRITTRIINEVRGINRVVYDLTSKPPGTIEWE